MKKVKVSVIVPVYNVENYLEKCLDSLVNQTLKQVEIILVDDGSKDNSPKIIDEYAEKYNNIKVIHKKNEGVSIARNIGLKEATGEYVTFLDSDDWLEKDCFIKAYNKAKEGNYDIVAFDTLAIYPDKNVCISSNIEEGQDNKKLMLDAYAVIWNKIYRRELIEDNPFKANATFTEDVLFLYQMYPKINKMASIKEPLHNYLQRQGSLTYTYNEKLYQLVDTMDDVVKFYKKNHYFNTYKDEIEYSYVRYLYATFIKRLAKTKNKKEFVRGVNYVIKKVNEKFPNYRKNKYLKQMGIKGFYLKYFNKFIAKIIFIKEKNTMN